MKEVWQIWCRHADGDFHGVEFPDDYESEEAAVADIVEKLGKKGLEFRYARRVS